MDRPKVILINPPDGLSEGRISRPSFCYQPLSLGYLAASLKEKNIKVEIIDAYAEATAPKIIIDRIKAFKVLGE